MYITLESPKRKLGLFDLEFQDLIVGGILTIFFIIFFTIEQYQIGLIFILAGIFLLVPVSFSKQNRMYKLIILFTRYLFRNKTFYYHKEDVRRDQHISKIKRNLKEIKNWKN